MAYARHILASGLNLGWEFAQWGRFAATEDASVNVFIFSCLYPVGGGGGGGRLDKSWGCSSHLLVSRYHLGYLLIC